MRKLIDGVGYKESNVLITETFNTRLRLEVEDLIKDFKTVTLIEKFKEKLKKKKSEKLSKCDRIKLIKMLKTHNNGGIEEEEEEIEDTKVDDSELLETLSRDLRSILVKNDLTTDQLINLKFETVMPLISKKYLKNLKDDCEKFHQNVVAGLKLESEVVIKGKKYYPIVEYLNEEVKLIATWNYVYEG